MVRKGRLRPLKTVEELQAGEAVVQVYVTRIPAKSSSRVLDALRCASAENGFAVQHLRRFAKADDLPFHLTFLASSADADKDSAVPSLCLILGTTKEFLIQALETILHDTLGQMFCNEIREITVPMLAPVSQEQASLWTKKYWPTVYKKNNPYGPHPSIVSRAQQELAQKVDEYMDLATCVSQEVYSAGIGEAAGVVIVYRKGTTSHPVSLAGDARWKGIEPRSGPGNVTAHAVMRAISMVAQKLKALDSKEKTLDSAEITSREIFMDKPLTAAEKAIYDAHEIAADGYLCHNLEIYITHEPCVMCCMAILHSRFGRVVFGQRMPKTGGMCAEGHTGPCSDGEVGLGLGLFWRKELNWSLLGWQWVPEEAENSNAVDPEIQV